MITIDNKIWQRPRLRSELSITLNIAFLFRKFEILLQVTITNTIPMCYLLVMILFTVVMKQLDDRAEIPKKHEIYENKISLSQTNAPTLTGFPQNIIVL